MGSSSSNKYDNEIEPIDPREEGKTSLMERKDELLKMAKRAIEGCYIARTTKEVSLPKVLQEYPNPREEIHKLVNAQDLVR